MYLLPINFSAIQFSFFWTRSMKVKVFDANIEKFSNNEKNFNLRLQNSKNRCVCKSLSQTFK